MFHLHLHLARPPSRLLLYHLLSIRLLSLSLSFPLRRLFSPPRSPVCPVVGWWQGCVVWKPRKAGTHGGVGYQTRSRLPTASFFSFFLPPDLSPFLSPRFCPCLSFLPLGSLSLSLGCLGSRPFPPSRRAAILGNV